MKLAPKYNFGKYEKQRIIKLFRFFIKILVYNGIYILVHIQKILSIITNTIYGDIYIKS